MERRGFENIVFVGTFAESAMRSQLMEAGLYSQMAANTVEGYYLEGLYREAGVRPVVLSALVTEPFPRCRRLLVRGATVETDKRVVRNVGFVNVFPVNVIIQKSQLRREARQWAKTADGRTLVVVYALRAPFYAAAAEIKRRLPDSVVVNIVPDLPQHMHGKDSFIRGVLTAINRREISRGRKVVDGDVLYASPMAEGMQLPDDKWMVIEGIYEGPDGGIDSPEDRLLDSDERVIVYAGSLSRRYGVMNLVEGFRQSTVSNARLFIYGAGECADELVAISSNDDRVVYGGLVSPEEIRDVIARADLLVNPRPSDEEYTRYSCPSKTLEYMASGTPVLMTRLDGVPDEYYKFVFEIADETPRGISGALEAVFSLPDEERLKLGRSAQSFILSEKNSSRQAGRLLDFATGLLPGDRASLDV